jgi:hypothetical protein
MHILYKSIAAFFLIVTVAEAACPPSQPYRCVPGPNGKQMCGCGY